MAFAPAFEENFELGTRGSFDSETDVAGILNYKHYTQLANYDATIVGAIAPYRGAYCMEILLGGDASDHTLVKANIVANTKVAWVRFYFFLGKNFTATADDVLNIFEFQSAAAVQGVVGLRITAATGAVEIGTGQVAPTVYATQTLTKGRWYCIELATDVETGGTGTSTLYVDGTQVAQVTTITNIALTTTAFGVRNALSTTSGYMFFDCFVLDDTGTASDTAPRIYPYRDRYPETVMVTKSTHLALGDSEALNVTLLAGSSTDSVLKIYDTDIADVTDESNVVAFLNGTVTLVAVDLADVPMRVRRGMYVQLAGAAPRALIHIGRSNGWFSHGRVRQHGYKTRSNTKVTQ